MLIGHDHLFGLKPGPDKRITTNGMRDENRLPPNVAVALRVQSLRPARHATTSHERPWYIYELEQAAPTLLVISVSGCSEGFDQPYRQAYQESNIQIACILVIQP